MLLFVDTSAASERRDVRLRGIMPVELVGLSAFRRRFCLKSRCIDRFTVSKLKLSLASQETSGRPVSTGLASLLMSKLPGRLSPTKITKLGIQRGSYVALPNI